MDWLDAAVFTIDLITETNAFLRGLTMSEYVPLFSILLLLGGVVFWLMLIFAVVLGGCRLVMRGVWAVVDLMPSKGSGGSLPHVE